MEIICKVPKKRDEITPQHSFLSKLYKIFKITFAIIFLYYEENGWD